MKFITKYSESSLKNSIEYSNKIQTSKKFEINFDFLRSFRIFQNLCECGSPKQTNKQHNTKQKTDGECVHHK